eukprot:tig00000342_g24192.t1
MAPTAVHAETPAEAQELAVVYAALILHDDGIPVTADKLATLVKAAGVKVEPYWPTLFAKALEKRNLDELLNNIGSAPAAAPAAAAAAPAADEKKDDKKGKKEEKKEEEEEDGDMGLGLFD